MIIMRITCHIVNNLEILLLTFTQVSTADKVLLGWAVGLGFA